MLLSKEKHDANIENQELNATIKENEEKIKRLEVKVEEAKTLFKLSQKEKETRRS